MGDFFYKVINRVPILKLNMTAREINGHMNIYENSKKLGKILEELNWSCNRLIPSLSFNHLWLFCTNIRQMHDSKQQLMHFPGAKCSKKIVFCWDIHRFK